MIQSSRPKDTLVSVPVLTRYVKIKPIKNPSGSSLRPSNAGGNESLYFDSIGASLCVTRLSFSNLDVEIDPYRLEFPN